MDEEASLFVRLLNLPARRCLALVLVLFVVSVGLSVLLGLAFPMGYCGPALALVCAAGLFGWRGGLLCMAILYGLVVSLTVSALSHVTFSLLAKRQNTARPQQLL